MTRIVEGVPPHVDPNSNDPAVRRNRLDEALAEKAAVMAERRKHTDHNGHYRPPATDQQTPPASA